MQHALVTGASGFIGRVLCASLLDRGVHVSALQRHCADGPWNDCFCVDLAAGGPDPTILNGVDTVFHLAGHAHAHDDAEAEELHFATSVQGTRNLLAACRDTMPGVVFASSVKAMCESTPAQCLNEDSPALPASAYGRARREAELLVLEASARLHAVVMRLPLVYGVGVQGNLGSMLRAVAAGRLPLLPEFGNHRSLVHVQDACDALIAAALTPRARGRVYLVSDGQRYSSRQIQEAIYAASGRRRPLLVMPRALLQLAAVIGDGMTRLGVSRVPFDSARLQRLADHACFDCMRARQELGYVPRRVLADALPAMLAAIEGNGK